jgi:hypothetical protein
MRMKKLAYGMYMYPATILQKYIKFGTNILDKEWNILIVLDACRVDAIDQIAPEYEFIESVDSTWSVGSTSKEWYVHTFQSRDVTDISLVSGNSWTKHLFEDDPDWKYWTATRNSIWHELSLLDMLLSRPLPTSEEFNSYVPVVGDHGADLGTTPLPKEVTDAAIHEHRRIEPERMIIHYMQPHKPYVQEEQNGEIPDMHLNPLDSIEADNVSQKEVYAAYLQNLREVLNSVDRLLKNIDGGRVAITADHGELFGEWNAYAHPAAFPHPAVRKVPWIITGASNTAMETVDPPEQVEASLEERLTDLGYL